jgi:hypothetical protein
MISLKKYIESDREELLEAALSSYRQALEAMGNSGFRACPAMGGGLRQSLLSLQQALEADATPHLLQETEQRVTAELDQWGTSAAEVAGERDQRYVKQFQDFTGWLKAIADLCRLKPRNPRENLRAPLIRMKDNGSPYEQHNEVPP